MVSTDARPQDPSVVMTRIDGPCRAQNAVPQADEVLPERPLRQWVLSLSFALLFLLAKDPSARSEDSVPRWRHARRDGTAGPDGTGWPHWCRRLGWT